MKEMQVYQGKVVWFNNKNGYGFLEWKLDQKPQKDMFVHFSGIDCDGFKTIKKDQMVSFSISQNKHGDPIAINVRVIK